MATSEIQRVAVLVSVTLLAVVLELVRRRKLVEEYGIVWLVCAFGLLALSVWRRVLDSAAAAVGIYYPPSLLLLAAVAGVFVALLWFSVVLSRQRRQIERLIEDAALLSAEIRELRDGSAAQPPDGDAAVTPSASSEPYRPRR
jgi:hypothetical protein